MRSESAAGQEVGGRKEWLMVNCKWLMKIIKSIFLSVIIRLIRVIRVLFFPSSDF